MLENQNKPSLITKQAHWGSKPMSNNMMAASNNWRDRPDDQRYWDLSEMYQHALKQRDSAATSLVRAKDITMIVDPTQGLVAQGRSGAQAVPTHYAFGQLSSLVGAPAGYLRELGDDQLVAQNLNHGLQKRAEDVRLLLHKNGSMMLRAATSEEYTRIWDCDVLQGLIASSALRGWRNPPGRKVDGVRSRAATEQDVLAIASVSGGLAVKVGDQISPSGLYRSDRDMFAFLVDDTKRVEVDGANLVRGIIVRNSEVGAASLSLMKFYFDGVCGNHIIWGARDIEEVRIRHTGKADERWERQIVGEIRRYANASDADDRTKIASAQRFMLGETKADVIDALFNRKTLALARKTIDAAYTVVEETPRYGSPRSAWGIAQGLTQVSQTHGNMDARMAVDRAAGKIIEMAF